MKNFSKLALLSILSIGSFALSPAYAQQGTKMVGGAAMYPTKNIVENAVNSKVHTTLVAAVKAAGLVETLTSPGPFTVFAPINTAFAALPKGTVETLLKPENKSALTGILTYHVVAGSFSAQDLADLADSSGGMGKLKTVQGGTLVIKRRGKGALDVVDAKGGVAKITITNVNQSNGVIHVIDKVLLQ
jgi:uncharacterized surface protein with fasciclin (FAS1) repeats